MNLPIGRPEFNLRCVPKVRALAEKKFGKENLEKLFPKEDYQLTHNELFPHDVIQMENLGGDIEKVLNRRLTVGCFPWKFRGGESAFARVVALSSDFLGSFSFPFLPSPVFSSQDLDSAESPHSSEKPEKSNIEGKTTLAS